MLMDKHAVDAFVTGYEDLIPGLQLPDPDDRHVLAAAIRGHADVIVTKNLRDFPSDTIGSFDNIFASLTPESFVRGSVQFLWKTFSRHRTGCPTHRSLASRLTGRV
jgi:hypothetical protein